MSFNLSLICIKNIYAVRLNMFFPITRARPGTNDHPMIMFCHELTMAEFTGSSSLLVQEHSCGSSYRVIKRLNQKRSAIVKQCQTYQTLVDLVENVRLAAPEVLRFWKNYSESPEWMRDVCSRLDTFKFPPS